MKKLHPSERKVTFPLMGKRTSETIKDFLESLELNVIMPPPTTDETIKLGVKYCANMVCYPLKQTLGNYIQALEKGANTLLAYDTQGVCRFRQYNLLHEFTLTGLGYDYEMFVIKPNTIFSTMKEISGKSRLTVLKSIYKNFRKLKFDDEQVWAEDKPNIGIIGEIFSCVDERANFGLEKKIRSFGANPYNTATTTDFMQNTIPIFNWINLFKKDKLKLYKQEAEKYFGEWRPGHAFENIYNLLHLIDREVDGIVHVLPLSCMAETTIECYVDDICRKNRIPILRIPIDENSAEENLCTRLETFIELIKLKNE